MTDDEVNGWMKISPKAKDLSNRRFREFVSWFVNMSIMGNSETFHVYLKVCHWTSTQQSQALLQGLSSSPLKLKIDSVTNPFSSKNCHPCT